MLSWKIKTFISILGMKSIILALFAITIIIVILMPDETTGSPARFRNRNQRLGRRGRIGGSVTRRGNRSFRRNTRRRNFGFQSRQGRTFPSQDVLSPPLDDNVALESTSSDYDGSGDGEEVEVPHWCNPSHGMGSWMNFFKLRKWCSDNGYTKLGPYGGAAVGSSGDDGGSRANARADVDVGNDVGEEYVDDEYEY